MVENWETFHLASQVVNVYDRLISFQVWTVSLDVGRWSYQYLTMTGWQVSPDKMVTV